MTVPQPAASNADSEDGSFPAWSLSALRARHLLGLGLVALLAVISAWTAARAGDLRDGGAHLVNVAGRQRMLSQNIAATALASTCLTRPNDENGPSAVERTELDRLTSEFRAGHEEVMASWPAFGTAEGDEREAASLDAEVVAFLGAVTQFRRGLESGGATVQDAAALRLSSQAFLDRMDRFVGLCEERIDRQVNRSQRPHALALVATLAAILGVYGLILYPTEVRVDRQVRELRDQRRELEAALDKAAAASQVKSEFLANMSHELRTPLQAVLGYADVAATAAAESRPEDAAASWAVVRRNGRHLLRLINNVLDLSKVEAGRINLERFPIAPGPLLREMIATLRPRAAEGVRLSIEIDPEMPAAIATDPTRLRQVLLNLVANAVKFTAKGEVRLSVRPARSETGLRSELPVWEFVVSDTGCGIAEGELERLFRPFEQADASTTRAYGGTGLGLALSRRLAERLGGELTAESTLGEGSRFTLRLPAATATPPLDEEEPAGAVSAGPGEGQQDDEPLLGLRVLLAEDTEDNRRLLSFYLRRSGAEVETVENGRQAVDRLMGTDDEPPPDPPFDVVLMDMQMPVLDGYDAARELRARRYEGPIIALTAHAMAGDADVSDAAGCDGYAVKPISRDTLAATVLKAARRRLEAGSTV